jgi:hypothetical protein
MPNDKGKILWDFLVQTDRAISANRPDIIIENKVDKSVLLVDVSVPHDGKDLKAEISHLWDCRVVDVIPLVIGAMSVVGKTITSLLTRVSPTACLELFQKSVVLGSARLIRRTLGNVCTL